MQHSVKRGHLRRAAVLAILSSLLSLFAVLAASSRESSVDAATAQQPTLSNPDRACATCHEAIYRKYEATAMARGSGIATEELRPGSFTSSASGVSYRVRERGGIALLTSQRDDERAPLADSETLEYYIGSGLHGRTYLFRRNMPGTDSALWYEAPVNWYTRRSAYDMAPAFDRSQTAPLALPTDSGCLHCHATAVAEPLEGSANRFRGAPFHQGGVGCTACHGDAAAHLNSGGIAPMLRLAALAPKRQDSVCLQCHLEGDAMVQRPGRSLAHFQPGEDLNDTAVYFVNASSPKTAARASSQYEGLLRSACKRASGERLTCVTCHDPHGEPAAEQRVAFYRAKCLQCHADTATFKAAAHHPEQADCAQCHMPARSASDIAHEQNVDHDIEARKDARQTKLTRNGAAGFARAVDLVPVGDARPTDRERGLAYAQFAARGDQGSLSQALTLLQQAERDGHADALVHQQLGYLQQLTGQNAPAAKEYELALQQQPHDATSETNLAVVKAASGNTAESLRLLADVAANAPDRTAALLDLAMLQCRSNQSSAAKSTLQRALAFQPDSFEARQFLATGDYAGMHCRMF